MGEGAGSLLSVRWGRSVCRWTELLNADECLESVVQSFCFQTTEVKVPSLTRIHERDCFAVHRSVTAGNYDATGPCERADGKSKKEQPPPYCPPLATSAFHRPPAAPFPC